ncbi:HNH endonuclease [Halobacterium salinarum]|uniref:HNH endonuclease n=1 Tax=Halobacterium salinarum TaxID=2242 RepID=UPI00255745BA|nr:HNH endonuclease [Halobacterium salinarum]MDL0121119.1 HNH endonuclease [Halobacterium salinarum]MDL0135800.1 HNH endonuclease [Halobacterium salinarum]MDL0138290.1 HNH endonuclease [Halobacterium salinarum]
MGPGCLVCGRSPEGWLNTTKGERRQDKLSLHHVTGDDTDDRVANVIPLCQSCHVHIHKVDEPPDRQWHRQLPIEHRNAWNDHYEEFYEGPRLNSKQAEWFFGDDQGTPESEKYQRHEPTSQNASDSDDETTAEPPTGDTTDETNVGSTEGSDNEDTTTTRHGVDPDLDPETLSIEYTPADGDQCRIRFVERDDGPGWWQRTETWTGHRWRPIDRKPITNLNITTD